MKKSFSNNAMAKPLDGEEQASVIHRLKETNEDSKR